MDYSSDSENYDFNPYHTRLEEEKGTSLPCWGRAGFVLPDLSQIFIPSYAMKPTKNISPPKMKNMALHTLTGNVKPISGPKFTIYTANDDAVMLNHVSEDTSPKDSESVSCNSLDPPKCPNDPEDDRKLYSDPPKCSNEQEDDRKLYSKLDDKLIDVNKAGDNGKICDDPNFTLLMKKNPKTPEVGINPKGKKKKKQKKKAPKSLPMPMLLPQSTRTPDEEAYFRTRQYVLSLDLPGHSPDLQEKSAWSTDCWNSDVDNELLDDVLEQHRVVDPIEKVAETLVNSEENVEDFAATETCIVIEHIPEHTSRDDFVELLRSFGEINKMKFEKSGESLKLKLDISCDLDWMVDCLDDSTFFADSPKSLKVYIHQPSLL